MTILNRIKRKLRNVYYSQKFKTFGTGSMVNGKIHLIHPERIEVGKNTSLNQGVFLGGKGGIRIGDNVHISPYAQLHTGYLNKQLKHHYEGIIVGNNVWIASGAIISHGVKIGDNVTIGALSVVLDDIPSDSFACGSPAKVK